MIGTVLVYTGLWVGALGALSLLRPVRLLGVRSRRHASAVLAAGAVVTTTGALLPAPTRRVAVSSSRLDEIVPAWQFAERHELRVEASPASVDAAIRRVTGAEIRLFRVLTWIRNPARSWRDEPESLLAPPADRPILDVALGSGFTTLTDDAGREIVIGTLVIVPPTITEMSTNDLVAWRESRSAEWFTGLSKPGYAKAVMNFRIVDEGAGWSRVVTETRVFATDDSTRQRFAAYWRVIYPGSALIRRMWLRAIRERAEASSKAGRRSGVA